MSVLLDAGPTLNFLAVGQQNVLLQTAEHGGLQLTVPERVDAEVAGKGSSARFRRTGVVRTWAALRSSERVVVLSDDLTTEPFSTAISRVSGMPAEKRITDTSSLGEILVLAHASVLAQAGTDVFVLIDERDGRRRADRERRWLSAKGAPGQLHLWSTKQVLKNADPSWFVGGHSWAKVYSQMRPFDDGLLPL
ncbi:MULTISPECIES: hypothetical protein [unclassified Blastococcus]